MRRPPTPRTVTLLLVALVLAAGCSTSDPAGTPATGAGAAADCSASADAAHPDVVDAELTPVGDRRFEVSATVCSAYDTPQRYADAWRVRTAEGDVLGVRELLHDHAGEQPFTRSLADPVEVPPGVEEVVIEGRDLANGWGGATVTVPLPTDGSR